MRGRDLVKASLGQSSPTGSGGAVPLAPSPPDASVCRTRTSPIGTTMNLTFLVFTTAGGSDPAAVLTFAPTDTALDVVVDTVGPDAPSHAVVAPAPGGVSVSWTPTQQPDESGFVTLCATSPTCPSDALLDGADGRTVDAKYVCGKPLDVTTSTTVVDGLQPGTPQTVAVAGVDLVGNVGRLALAGCVAPEAAPEAANDGGAGTKNPNAPIQAGCACGVAPSAGGGAGALVFALGALGTLGVARRRRTR